MATLHSGVGYSRPVSCRRRPTCARAAEVLNAGKKVAMLVGAGALGAAEEVIAVAERLGAGVAKALLGKAVLPDDLPWVTGCIGCWAPKPSYDMMKDCDTLLMVGSGFPYSEFLPEDGQARGVQIDIDPRMLSHALSDGGQPASATRPRRCAPCSRCCNARRDRSLARAASRRHGRVVEDAGGPGACSPPTRSIRSGSPGSCRRGCPTGRSSRATPAPAPTGLRGT